MNRSVEVSFSPELYPYKLTRENFITVVTDVFRATTSITAAIDYGIASIIPVEGVEKAKEMKKNGHWVACERNGEILDFADIGNSPSDFLKEGLKNQTIVFSTTNGTQAINMAKDAEDVVIGAFINLQYLTDWLIQQNKNVVILCAAWKKLFNLEDSVFAGALAYNLLQNEKFYTECDSAKAAMDLWEKAKPDLKQYLSKASHRKRLRHILSELDFNYTVNVSCCRTIPVLKEEHLVKLT